MTPDKIRHHMRVAEQRITQVAEHVESVRVERKVSRLQLSKGLGIDNVRLHYFCKGRMILPSEDMDKLIDWLEAEQ